MRSTRTSLNLHKLGFSLTAAVLASVLDHWPTQSLLSSASTTQIRSATTYTSSSAVDTGSCLLFGPLFLSYTPVRQHGRGLTRQAPYFASYFTPCFCSEAPPANSTGGVKGSSSSKGLFRQPAWAHSAPGKSTGWLLFCACSIV